MKELAKTYDPSSIEDRTYAKWMGRKYFHRSRQKQKTVYYRDAAAKYYR